MIYIASPYTHADPAVRQRRFEDVYHYVAERMLQGAVVYSPIAHSNPITPSASSCRWIGIFGSTFTAP